MSAFFASPSRLGRAQREGVSIVTFGGGGSQ